MAIRKKLTKQFPWVGTETQDAVITEAADRLGVSKAEIIRHAVDHVYGLRAGELPANWTIEESVSAGQALIQGPSPHGDRPAR